MAIKEKVDPESGKKLFEVYVSVRSRTLKNVRVQKRKTGIQNRAQALRFEKELTKKCFEQLFQRENRASSWGEIVQKWRDFKLSDQFEPIGAQTLDDYFNAMKKWTASIWDRPANKITRAHIREIISIMDRDERSKSFQAKMKGLISRIFIWGVEEELIAGAFQNPTIGIKVTRKKERVPTILSGIEIKRFLSLAKSQDHPWFPIWAVALYTGCRNGELYALTWDDISFSTNLIRISKSFERRTSKIKSTKAGYWRNVPINTELKSILLSLKHTNPDSEFVLPRLREWRQGNQATELRKFLMGNGLKPIRFHDLRACFATQMLQNKVPPATVMKICGWKDLDTMGRYIRLAGIDEIGATDCLNLLQH